MEKRLLLLPVDGRPVVRGQLKHLARLAGWDLALPPISMLGYFREAANRDGISDWLLEQADGVDGFVLSLDTLVYGGLVASRISADSADSLLARADCLKTLRRMCPSKPIYGFLATMRISNSNVDEEEKEYWSSYGESIWKWSYHADKHRVDGDENDLRLSQEAKSSIPADIRDDYLATRSRNAGIAQAMLDLAKDGALQRLVLPQDDNAPYGFNIAEARELQQRVNDSDLRRREEIRSGADEVAWTLAARMISHLERRPARNVYLSWHHPGDAATIVPRYENQPVGIAVNSQLRAAGANIALGIKDADLVLGIHTANQPQGDWAVRKALGRKNPLRSAWMEALARRQKDGLPVAIADLAYANGGDPDFFNLAVERLDIESLIAYGAWNTASNSLGTVAAQIQLSPLRRPSAPGMALKITRLIDDAFYQAGYRQVVRRKLEAGAWTLDRAKQAFCDAANQWLREHSITCFKVCNAFFPWNRSFEIGFELKSVGRRGMGDGGGCGPRAERAHPQFDSAAKARMVEFFPADLPHPCSWASGGFAQIHKLWA